MTRSLYALWAVITLAVITMVALGQFWLRQRTMLEEQRVREILRTQLLPTNDSVAQVVDGYSIELQRAMVGRNLQDPAACVDLKRLPLADLIVVVDDEGRLQFPDSWGQLTTSELTMVDEARQLLVEQIPTTPSRSRASQSADSQSLSDLQGGSPLDPSVAQQEAQSPTADATTQALQQSKVYYGNRSGTSAAGPPPALAEQSDAQVAVPTNRVTRNDGISQQPAVATNESLSATTNPPQQTQPPTAQSEGTRSDGPDDDRTRLEEAAAVIETTGAADVLSGMTASNFGWITWYHRRGMVLGFWSYRPDQERRILICLPRARWMADLVAILPDNGEGTFSKSPQLESGGNSGADDGGLAGEMGGTLKQLVDIEGSVIYQWGDVQESLREQAQQGLVPDAEVPVAEPLEGWRLRIFATPQLRQRLAGNDLVMPIWLAISSIAIAMVFGGIFITASLNREVRLAHRRVSFVNQVSHELRTPLTNIRMYADLMANDLAGSHEASNKQLDRLSVIRNESQRLSRLIANVLQFARLGKDSATLRKSPVCLDQLVEDVVAAFQPRLQELDFKIELSLNTPECRWLDRDAVEQILVNLISNAEKYAARGRYLRIQTDAHDHQVRLNVLDHGPGIPPRMREKIFAPFQRLSDRLEDPAGTGIGLTIVRELAMRHGGDCHLQSSESGAEFSCTLEAPVCDSTEDSETSEGSS